MLRQGPAHLLRRLHGGVRGWEQLPAAASAALHHTSGGTAAAAAAAAEPRPASQHASGSWQLAFAALLGLAGSAAVGRAEEAHPPPPDADKVRGGEAAQPGWHFASPCTAAAPPAPARTYTSSLCCTWRVCCTIHTQQGFSLMSLDQRRRLFFKYEKRIRELSLPEKVGAGVCHMVWIARWVTGSSHSASCIPAERIRGRSPPATVRVCSGRWAALAGWDAHLGCLPLQVFEYFASQRDGKVFTMTAGDMMRRCGWMCAAWPGWQTGRATAARPATPPLGPVQPHQQAGTCRLLLSLLQRGARVPT